MIFRRRHRVRRLVRLLFLVVFVFVLGSILLRFIPTRKDVLSTTATIHPTPQIPKGATLQEVVERTLLGTKGTYGIVIHNFKTGEAYQSQENRVFEPGSLYKLWVMGTVFQQLRDGKLKEDTKLEEKIEELNERFHIASEAAELTEGEVSFTVRQALSQMITISHNYAALLLAVTVRLTSVEAFLKENGFIHSKLGEPPKTTPSDIALFFEKLYKGTLAPPEESEKMLALLKAQRLNNKLPKYLPEGVVIAHKTGELGKFTHDAGIVYTKDGDYLIVILSESTNPAGAEERIAEVSEAVYHYFSE